MNSIGDIERFVAANLYPLRVPVAIVLVVGVIGLAAIARRRGWFAAARRHPGRTVSLVVVALAIGLPVGWYLGSPLFIRTELIEPTPLGVAAAATAAPSLAPTLDPTMTEAPAGAATAEPTAERSAEPTPEPTPFVPIALLGGTFHGADDFHFGEGAASIIETAPGRYTLRFEAFSVRNGPDLFVYLSPKADGYADGSLEIGTLKATDGAFGYELPEGTDPAHFASAVIWCRQFAVLFAVAPLAAI